MSAKKPLVLLLSFLWPLLAPAQDSTRLMTLRDCVAYTLEHVPAIRQAELDIEKARQQIRELTAQALPKVSLDADLRYNLARPAEIAPGELFDVPTRDIPVRFGKKIQSGIDLTLRQPIAYQSQAAAREGRDKLLDVQELRLRKSREDAALETARTYCQALLVREKRSLLEANLDRIDGLLQLAQRQYQSGFAKEVEVKRLRVARKNLEVQLRNFDLQYEQLLQALQYRMAMPLTERIELSDELPAEDLPVAETLLLSPDLNRRPELPMLRLRNDLSQLQVDRLRSAAAPRLFLEGALRLTAWGDTPAEWARTDYWYGDSFVGLRLSYPIFDGFERRARIAQAQLEVERGQYDLQFAEQSLQLQWNAAVQKWRVQRNELQSLRDNRDLAEEVYRITQLSYEQGVTPIMDLLAAETALREAQTNYLTARLDARLAELEALAARGELLERLP